MKKESTMRDLGRKLHFNILEDKEKQILQDAVCRLLWETGVMVECPEAAERFGTAGAKVIKRSDDFIVKIPEWMIMESIASSPSNLPWYGQSPELDYFPGSGEYTLSTFAQHVQVIDPKTREVRPSTKKDGENLYRLYNFLPYAKIQLDSVAAREYDARALNAAGVHSMLSSSGKFGVCMGTGVEEGTAILKMCHAVAGGEEKFRERPFLTINASPISPLMLKKDCTDTLSFTAETGIISHPVNMCLAGATGPVTLAGSVVLSVAELLAALAYTQIVVKGAPTLLTTCSSIMDMKSGLAASGSPDTATICGASAAFLAHYGFYGFFNSGVTDAKIPDAQAGYEFTTNAALMSASGNPVGFGAGSVEGGITFDYAKLLLDHECFTNIRKYLDGISWCQENLALELMKEVGPGNSFIQHKSTFKGFKAHLSKNDLFSRTSREAWENAGSLSASEAAYARVNELLAKPHQHLSPSVQAEIDGLLAEHVSKVSA